MRLGFYLGRMDPLKGGNYTYKESLCRALLAAAPRDLEVVLLHRGAAPELHAGEAPWLRCVDVPSESALGRARQRLVGAVRLLAGRPNWVCGSLHAACLAHRIDLLWFPTQTTECVDIPFVFTILDMQHRIMPFLPELSAPGMYDMREGVGEFVRRATFVITGTQRGREEVQTCYGVNSERMRVLPHPTPEFALDPASPAVPLDRLGLPERFFLYPARFWAHKNHLLVLEALRILGERGETGVTAVFVGSDAGNLAHVRREAERLGVAGRVRFAGFVSREELVALYRRAQALVYTSLYGPENLPPLEAFALGCPVIATRWLGAEEQLGDAALLVDPFRPQELADAMLRVATDEGVREQLRSRGRARAQRFTTKDYLAGVLDIVGEFKLVRRLWGG